MLRPTAYCQLLTVYWMLSFAGLSANGAFNLADSLYHEGDYPGALFHYQQLANSDRYFRHDLMLNFKIAMCYLHGKDYHPAGQIFELLRRQQNDIPEYIDYFYFRALLGQRNVKTARAIADNFFGKYKRHFLADSLRLQLADAEYKMKNYQTAERHYLQLTRNKNYKDLNPYLESQIAFCKMNRGHEKDALDRMYQIIKKYPSKDEALKIAGYFNSEPSLRQKYFFTIADVYLEHRYYSELTANIEAYIKSTDEENEKERARFYLLKVYYARGEYQKALYGFNSMMNELGDSSLDSHLRLMIARTRLRLDDKRGAAAAYLDYSDKYPRRRIAADAAWKAAWLFEELGNVESAMAQYQKITEHWSGSGYLREAKFRMGLSFYRMGKYPQAEIIFQSIINSRWDDFHKERASYWLAKVFQQSGRAMQADAVLKDLSMNRFESYYAIKSYLEINNVVDQTKISRGAVATAENPLRQYTQSIEIVMNSFAKLFIIQDLLGDAYAHQELEDKRYQASTLGEWIALAEVYKRLEAYHRAFQVYDYINNKYFADLSVEEKPYLLKEAYPLYYDNIVDTYCQLRLLDKNMVLAIIRAESGYNRHAHSRADAYGLMQLIPPTANAVADEIEFNLSSTQMLFNPEVNINLGTFYFRQLLNQFDNRIEYALAAYNAGPHRVKRWQNITPDEETDLFVENIEFSETRNYVRKVMRNYWIYTFLDKMN